jgi:ACS family hexuronate transporter-like MFS transporter
MATPSTLVRPAPTRSRETTSFRWVICGLLFFAATINYIDRQVIGILKPTLQRDLGWTEIDYGDIVFAFQLAYAIGFVFAGRLIDRLGTKLGLALALVVWSAAALAHAGATTYGGSAAAVLAVLGLRYSASVAGFMAARFALGIGESGSFPASLKAVAEWFPRRDRAFATGLFNAGTNVGAVITPLVVPWITIQLGWRWAFAVTGALGFAWLLSWWAIYEAPDRHPRVSPGELALIREGAGEKDAAIPWRALLPHRQTWAFAIAKLLTDPIWWLYLFWVPDFFSRTHGLSLSELGPPIIVIYLMADVGSVGGGWLSSMLIRRGWSLNAARKTAMLICACAVVPIVLAPRVTGEWTAVALIGLAAAAHQGWSANLFTLPSDLFPKPAVGSVVGIGGTAGAIGGMLIAKLTASVLQVSGSYVPVFLIAGFAYLVALAIIQLLAPRLRPTEPIESERRAAA